MRKAKFVILCLLAVLLLTTVATEAEVYMTNTEHGMTGTTTVRLVIPSSYTVEIPASLPISYGAESTPMTIGVSSMHIGSNQAVKIAVDSARGKLLQTGGRGAIPYVLLCDGAEFGSKAYTEVGQTQLSFDITLEDWYSADAGEYTGTVTFQVSVVNREVGQ